MGSKVFLRVKGKVVGPFSMDQLKTLASQGKINRQTNICPEVDGNPSSTWRNADAIKGLFQEEIQVVDDKSQEVEQSGPIIATSPVEPLSDRGSRKNRKRGKVFVNKQSGFLKGLLVGFFTGLLVCGIGFGLMMGGLKSVQPEKKMASNNMQSSDPTTSEVALSKQDEEDVADKAKKFLDQYEKALDNPTASKQLEKLKEMGFLLKIDYEARNAIVDQFGWDVLSQVKEGRWLATHIISDGVTKATYEYDPSDGTLERITKENEAGEITLFSSENGRSLSYMNDNGKVSIFR